MHCGAGADVRVGVGTRGSLGRLGTGASVFGFCSLLPTLEFSAGQKANGGCWFWSPAWEVERCLSKDQSQGEKRGGDAVLALKGTMAGTW